MNIVAWNKAISMDNKVIKTLSDSQHRALSMLTTFEIKLEANEEKVIKNDTHSCKVIKRFFKKIVPVMLHTVCLPELNLYDCFIGEWNVYDIENKVREYLRYIDRKYGTWYEPIEHNYAA